MKDGYRTVATDQFHNNSFIKSFLYYICLCIRKNESMIELGEDRSID